MRLFSGQIKERLYQLRQCSHFVHRKTNIDHHRFHAIKLSNKRLLRVTGPQSFIYMQSLFTNDMRNLLNKPSSEPSNSNKSVIYTFLLSAVGRVLCDLFVYRGRACVDGEYFLEVDRLLANAIKRLLIGHNTSRQVNVELVNDVDLWSLVPDSALKLGSSSVNYQETLQQIDCDDIKLVQDPRVGSQHFGYRFFTRLGAKSINEVKKYLKSDYMPIDLLESTIGTYNKLKYRLGIPEGYQDILSGFYFPFELNGDFLNAICLDKGLFTSEEKVIKIYSSTPIKRRIFPVEFVCSNDSIRKWNPAPRTLISTQYMKDVGELRGRSGRFGIATLPIPLNSMYNFDKTIFSKLVHKDTRLVIKASIPNWWPTDLTQIHLNVPEYPLCLFNFQSEQFSLASRPIAQS